MNLCVGVCACAREVPCSLACALAHLLPLSPILSWPRLVSSTGSATAGGTRAGGSAATKLSGQGQYESKWNWAQVSFLMNFWFRV